MIINFLVSTQIYSKTDGHTATFDSKNYNFEPISILIGRKT